MRSDSMDKYMEESFFAIGVGLILIIAFYGAFKASQVLQRRDNIISEIEIETLKLKIEEVLRTLWRDYTLF